MNKIDRKRMKTLMLVPIVMVLLMTAGCPLTVNQTSPSSDPSLTLPAGSLGSWDNPVKCDGPPGEREYLDRLRGPDGLAVSYRRLGNGGTGVNGNIVDIYLVESRDGSVKREVIMDMYYPGYREEKAIEGFFMADKMT